jgi:hypothetical protein
VKDQRPTDGSRQVHYSDLKKVRSREEPLKKRLPDHAAGVDKGRFF